MDRLGLALQVAGCQILRFDFNLGRACQNRSDPQHVAVAVPFWVPIFARIASLTNAHPRRAPT